MWAIHDNISPMMPHHQRAYLFYGVSSWKDTIGHADYLRCGISSQPDRCTNGNGTSSEPIEAGIKPGTHLKDIMKPRKPTNHYRLTLRHMNKLSMEDLIKIESCMMAIKTNREIADLWDKEGQGNVTRLLSTSKSVIYKNRDRISKKGDVIHFK